MAEYSWGKIKKLQRCWSGQQMSYRSWDKKWDKLNHTVAYCLVQNAQITLISLRERKSLSILGFHTLGLIHLPVIFITLLMLMQICLWKIICLLHYSWFHYDISQCFPNKQSFSILNCNVRSLSKNYNNFTNMLSNLYHPFSLIGLSETKITSD